MWEGVMGRHVMVMAHGTTVVPLDTPKHAHYTTRFDIGQARKSFAIPANMTVVFYTPSGVPLPTMYGFEMAEVLNAQIRTNSFVLQELTNGNTASFREVFNRTHPALLLPQNLPEVTVGGATILDHIFSVE